MVDGGEPGVDSRDEGKHTGRNDLLLQSASSATRICLTSSGNTIKLKLITRIILMFKKHI